MSFYEMLSTNKEEDREMQFLDYINNGGMPARFDFELTYPKFDGHKIVII